MAQATVDPPQKYETIAPMFLLRGALSFSPRGAEHAERSIKDRWTIVPFVGSPREIRFFAFRAALAGKVPLHDWGAQWT